MTTLLLLFLATIIPQAPHDQTPPDPPYINGYAEPAYNGTGAHYVALGWSLIRPEGYRIYRTQDSNPFVPLNNVNLDNYGQFTDRHVKSNHTYSYYVTAVLDGVESAPSNIISITVPPAPPPPGR